MKRLKKTLLKFKPLLYYVEGKRLLNDPYYLEGRRRDKTERRKGPLKAEILNYLLSSFERDTCYLEIGVRNPDHNFNRICANTKYSVDPGIEFKENPVDFPMTSDEFFDKLSNNEILSREIKFDLIFIDGLHLAEQVDRDIKNSLNFIKDDGFIVIHDCNPPTEWHARLEYFYRHTPAGPSWNGSTWKAFLKWRSKGSVYSCCIDTDWGLGVLSKAQRIGKNLDKEIEFYEFRDLSENRHQYLNLLSFENFKNIVSNLAVNDDGC